MRFPWLCLLLAGCVTTAPPTQLASSFNPAEVAWFNKPGTNTIRGNAVMRTVSGEIRTCAGLDANLVPASTYAKERFSQMYGERASGFLAATRGFQFFSTDPAYVTASSTTKCDSLGNFAFERVPDGEYYVTAKVLWGVPQRYFTSWQGGYLMQRVRIGGGETQQIVLTAD